VDDVPTAKRRAIDPGPDQFTIEIGIRDLLGREPNCEWRDHIKAVATELIGEDA
jgi:hypothetical protein